MKIFGNGFSLSGLFGGGSISIDVARDKLFGEPGNSVVKGACEMTGESNETFFKNLVFGESRREVETKVTWARLPDYIKFWHHDIPAKALTGEDGVELDDVYKSSADVTFDGKCLRQYGAFITCAMKARIPGSKREREKYTIQVEGDTFSFEDGRLQKLNGKTIVKEGKK